MSEIEKNKDAIAAPAATLPEDKEVAEQVYHSRYPGSNFIDRNGQVHTFKGDGSLRTTSKNLITELDKIKDKSGSPIYTTEKPVISPAEKAPVNEIMTRAAQVKAELEAAQAAKNTG